MTHKNDNNQPPNWIADLILAIIGITSIILIVWLSGVLA